MTVQSIVKTSEYHDSVSLMLVARQLAGMPGVRDAAVVMATEANKAILAEAGLLDEQGRAASANDLVIAVSAGDPSVAEAALKSAEKLLTQKAAMSEREGFRPKTVRSAVASYPDANVAVISVAGRYAADEAWDALERDLHVLLFSDNVSLEDEIALKKYASEHGLLLMGPGAGTTILNGVALGFANALPSGQVGIISAAGTGLQEVSTLLAKQGLGITQGIGTGGRDLKREVGGIMMLDGLRALQKDAHTQVIVLISKPPSEAVVQKILDQASASDKPTVVCFMGGERGAMQKGPNLIPAVTLQEAALLAARAAGVDLPDLSEMMRMENSDLSEQAQRLRSELQDGQRYLRGLFSGGTLCYEAQVVWRQMLEEPVNSNAPLPGEPALQDSLKSRQHTAVDLGEEEFTVGRPHPMIDNDLRIRRLLQEAADPETAVIFLDVVLGYGAHPDPASELGPAIEQAAKLAGENDRRLIFVASVTGTEDDPQGLSRTTTRLEEAGAVVCGSNAAAARLAAMVVA